MFSQKTKIENSHDPSVPFFGLLSAKNENSNLKRYMQLSVHSSSIYNSQDTGGTQMPKTDEWTKNMVGVYICICIYIYIYIHTHTTEYYSAMIWTWIDLENIMFSEMIREVNCMKYHLYLESKKIKINIYVEQKYTDMENRGY